MVASVGRSLIISIVAVAAAVWMGPAAAQADQIRASHGGDIRALVIGIDAYNVMPRLKGAIADARDIEFDAPSQWRRRCNRAL